MRHRTQKGVGKGTPKPCYHLQRGAANPVKVSQLCEPAQQLLRRKSRNVPQRSAPDHCGKLVVCKREVTQRVTHIQTQEVPVEVEEQVQVEERVETNCATGGGCCGSSRKTVKQPEEHVRQLEDVQVEHKEREALPEERVADTEKEEAVDGLQVLPEIRTPAVAAQWDRSRSHSRGMEALKVRQDDEKMRAENCTSMRK